MYLCLQGNLANLPGGKLQPAPAKVSAGFWFNAVKSSKKLCLHYKSERKSLGPALGIKEQPSSVSWAYSLTASHKKERLSRLSALFPYCQRDREVMQDWATTGGWKDPSSESWLAYKHEDNAIYLKNIRMGFWEWSWEETTMQGGTKTLNLQYMISHLCLGTSFMGYVGGLLQSDLPLPGVGTM